MDRFRQPVDARWAGQDVTARSSSVCAYTEVRMAQLRAQWTAPDMVQVGHEINGGRFWDVGRIGNTAKFVKLTNAAETVA